MRELSAPEVRARLDHPVIDADGHIIEYLPAIFDVVRELGGPVLQRQASELFAGQDRTSGGAPIDRSWYGKSWTERLDRRITRQPRWTIPAENSRDRATAMLPRYLYGRLPELGIDHAVCYPTSCGALARTPDVELRTVGCRAYNMLYAAEFDGLGDRLTPVALIPMHSPEEAIAELEFSVKTLGYKAIVITGGAYRPIPALARDAPEYAYLVPWLDLYGLDSAYDYDPVWAKCDELGIAVGSHGGGMGFGSRRSISNFMFNHSGHFAAGAEPLAKALWMGGVTRRFPNVNFAFLEAGVAWAASLVNDLVELWGKRNGESITKFDPTRVDASALKDYVSTYGSERYRSLLANDFTALGAFSSDREDPEMRDEWRACDVKSKHDLAALFVDHFYFGCEADDPLTAIGFDRRIMPTGRPLRAMFSSDIGHYDVPNMGDVLPEAYEHLDRGLLDRADFRAFMFDNAALLYTRGNPNFFRGTTVENEVEHILRPASA